MSKLQQFPHPPHVSKTGHQFHIDNQGTAVQLTMHDSVIVLTGEEAKELRDWLASSELRSQAEADALDPREHEVTGGVAHAPGDANIPDGVVRGQHEHEIADLRKNPHPDIGKPYKPKGK